MVDGNLPQNGANKVYIQGEEESEEQEDPILIETDCKITLRPLLCFGTTISRGCRIIGFVQGIPQFTNDKFWEDRLERRYLLLVLLKLLTNCIDNVQQNI